MASLRTSWGNVAAWYEDLLSGGEDTYQREVILPHLLRLMGPLAGKQVADVGCGPGYFVKEFAERGANVVGVDISPELVAAGKKYLAEARLGPRAGRVTWHVANAESMPMIATGSVDIITIVLAIQNMAKPQAVTTECARILKSDGRLLLVLNHPVFRIPGASGWGWDEEKSVQYRRVDRYLSEATMKIDMHPGQKRRDYTISFHRSLQVYMKQLRNAGLAITELEEWISHRQGPKGKRFAASERARKEIPLFLFLGARKFN